MRLPPVLLVTPLLLTACALTPKEARRAQADAASTQQKLDARLAGYTRQPDTDCIAEFPNRSSTAFGSKILYSGVGNTLYVNQTTGGCESMERGDYIVTVSHTGRLCNGDIGRTFQPQLSTPTGSCALGRFTPYVRN